MRKHIVGLLGAASLAATTIAGVPAAQATSTAPVPVAAAPDTAAADAARSKVGGAIKRSEAISRAHYWYKRRANISYSWTGTYPDPQGRRYRRDCSGYVSMALHLSRSRSTVDLPNVGKRIAKKNMKAGDYIGRLGSGTGGAGGHVRLFHKWSKKSSGTYWAYDFGSTPVKHRVYRVESGHRAYRYGKIREDKPPTTNRPIKRSTVLKRAKWWVDHKIRYNSAKTQGGYRRDGSGYVSMAWHIRDSKNSGGFVTNTTLGRFAKKIKKSQLKPGDAMLNKKPGKKGHILIFAKWLNKSHTKYQAYQLHRKVGVAKLRTITYPYFKQSSFVPVRYNKIVG